jgi:hypothetical protein
VFSNEDYKIQIANVRFLTGTFAWGKKEENNNNLSQSFINHTDDKHEQDDGLVQFLILFKLLCK